jgi:hypothetical protein
VAHRRRRNLPCGGRRGRHRERRSLCTHELTVIPGRACRVEVACDGEVFTLTAPLVYRLLPRALKVVVPKPPPPASREMRGAADAGKPAGQI